MVRQYDAQKMCDAKLRTFAQLGLWKTTFVNKQEDMWIARCYHDMRRIVFNTFYLQASTIEEVEETMLHEIAHALVGPGKGHGPDWIRQAVELGLKEPGPCRLLTISRDKARSIQVKADELKEKPKRKFNRVEAA